MPRTIPMPKRQHVAALACTMFCVAPTSIAAKDWSFEITPYVWLPEMKTSFDIGPNPPVDGSKSLLDVLNGAFLIRGHAQRGKWRFMGEFNYLKLGDDLASTPVGSLASWELEGVMASLAAGYAVFEDTRSRMEVIGGLRGWQLGLSTRVLRFEADTDESWVDPIIGASFETALNSRLKLEALANIGGFGVGSEFQWEALAELDWAISDTISAAIGYRHLDLEFTGSDVLLDMQLTGPYVAVGFRF